MVEFYATLGEDKSPVRELIDKVDRLELLVSTPLLTVAAPENAHWIETADEENISTVLVGNIFSIQSASGNYDAVTNNTTLVHDIYTSDDSNIDEKLNGEFIVIISDHNTEEITIVTDRLSTLPGFRYRGRDDIVRITTNMQLFAFDSGIDPQYHPDYLAEFFTFQRVFGIYTPLERATKLPPATAISYNPYSGDDSEETYWKPDYNPSNRSYDYFVDEFVSRLSEVLHERITSDERVGLLLSGGSDSRLLARLIDRDMRAYHMNEFKNKEAKTAATIADVTDIDFRFLQRDIDYYFRVLEKDGEYDNYTSWFHESHFVGFEDELSEEDVIITGLFADMIFRGFYTPRKTISIPGLGFEIKLPDHRPINTIDDLLEYRLQDVCVHQEVPTYFQHDRSISDILSENIRQEGNYIVDHGIRHLSINSAMWSYYPLTNDYSRDYFGLLRVGPRWSPFLDNRLIDLQLQMPIRYMTHNNIINDAIERVDPSLLAIPHSDSGLRLNRSRGLHQVSKSLKEFIRMTGINSEEVSYGSQGSWADHKELFRENPSFEEYLRSEDSARKLENMDIIDKDKLYEELQSDKYWLDFYPLLTVLATPLTERITQSN